MATPYVPPGRDADARRRRGSPQLTRVLIGAVITVWVIAIGLLAFFAFTWRSAPMEIVGLG